MALAAVRPVFVSVTRSFAAPAGGLHDSCTRDLGRKDGQPGGRLLRCNQAGCVRALATKPPDNGDAEEQAARVDTGPIRPGPAGGPVAQRGPGHLHGQARGWPLRLSD